MSVRITNYGLDAVAAINPDPPTGLARFETWIRFTAIGTGTTAPAQTDTALAAETARTESRGGFASSNTFLRDTVANIARVTHTSRRVFTFTAAFNLTEFGHFTASTGANCVFRDLFRTTPNDPASAPVVISVTAGQELHIIRTLIIQVPWQAVTSTFTISGTAGNNGAGAHTGSATAYATTDSSVEWMIRDIWPSIAPSLVAAHGTVSSARDTSLGGAGHANVVVTLQPYTTGSFTRVKRGLFGTGAANFTITAIAVSGHPQGVRDGYKFVLTNPADLVKASTHTLQLDFRSEWGRL